MEKKSAPASPATARASSVLPVPGGPHSSTPLGTLEPERLNLSGFKKKSTTSISSSFASPMPATSAKVMLRPRVRTARRKSRAGWCGAWCTVSYAARTKPGIAGGERSARAPLLFLQLQAGGAARPRALARALLPGRVCLRAARSRVTPSALPSSPPSPSRRALTRRAPERINERAPSMLLVGSAPPARRAAPCACASPAELRSPRRVSSGSARLRGQRRQRRRGCVSRPPPPNRARRAREPRAAPPPPPFGA